MKKTLLFAALTLVLSHVVEQMMNHHLNQQAVVNHLLVEEHQHIKQVKHQLHLVFLQRVLAHMLLQLNQSVVSNLEVMMKKHIS